MQYFTPVDSPDWEAERAQKRVKLVRKNDRHEIRKAVSIDCQVVRERDFRLIASRTIDLSPDGMLVPIEEDIAIGEPLVVTFQATQLGIWFDSEATVSRLLHGRRDYDKRPCMGLTFSTLDRVKRLVLRGHLRRVPPPLPKRAPRVDWSRSLQLESSLTLAELS